MKTIHTFLPGSEPWKAHRAQPDIFNGSELAAIMGLSSYVTRNELLHRKATGIEPEHDAATLKRFADGHAAEALARPIAEEHLDTDLSAQVMSDVIDGVLISVSLDGIDQSHDTTWEHKSLNKDLIAWLDAGRLPEEFHPQCEAGLMVSGATACLFMASKDGDMTTERHHWYESNPELRTRIIAACKQFAKDLAAYVPPEVAEKPIADAIMLLPAVVISASGSLSANNLHEVTPRFDKFLAEVNTNLVTDEDFVNGDAVGKFSRVTAKSLYTKTEEVIGQIASVSDAVNVLRHYAEKFDGMGLRLEKLVKSEKEQIKLKKLTKVKSTWLAHIAGLEAEIAPIRLNMPEPDFAASLRNLKKLDALDNALATCLATGKITADASAADIRYKLGWMQKAAGEFQFLFSDLQNIISKPVDDFQLLVTSRVANHHIEIAEKMEAARKRMEAEAIAKVVQLAQGSNFGQSASIDAPAFLSMAGVPTPISSDTSSFAGRPSRTQIIEAVARSFGVSILTANEWLRSEFGRG